MLMYCTLTGVDEKTDFGWIAEASVRYPFVEWGILFSHSPGEKDERYGTRTHIERFARHAWPEGINSALHVCGKAVESFVEDVNGVRDLASRFGRVQLNFNLGRSAFGVPKLDEAIREFGRAVITQHNEANATVAQAVTAANHQVLFDASGGRGLRAAEWPPRVNGKVYGYAGGFGPETAGDDLEGAARAAGGLPFWIDMETKLREGGYLSAERCERVLEAVQARLPKLGLAR